jgi:hypothetical protein
MTFARFIQYQAESVARACLKAIARHTKEPVKKPSQQTTGAAA